MKNIIKKLILFTLVISLLFDINVFTNNIFASGDNLNTQENNIVDNNSSSKDDTDTDSDNDNLDLDNSENSTNSDDLEGDTNTPQSDVELNNDPNDVDVDDDIEIDTEIKVNVVALLNGEQIKDSSLNPSKNIGRFDMSIYDILYNVFGNNKFEDNYTKKSYEVLNYEINGKIYDKNSIKEIKIDLSDENLKELNINVYCQNIFNFTAYIALNDTYHENIPLETLARSIKVRPKDNIKVQIDKGSRNIVITSSYETRTTTLPEYYRPIDGLNQEFEFNSEDNKKDFILDVRPVKRRYTGIDFKNYHNESNVKIYFLKLNQIQNFNNRKVFSNNYEINKTKEENNTSAIKTNTDSNFINSANLTVTNRVNENKDLEYEEDAIYHNDKIDVSLSEAFAEDVLSNNNHIYDFDLFMNDNNRKEMSKEDLNFSITPEIYSNKTFNFDSKRVNYTVISDFNGSKVENEYWITMDQMVKFKGQNFEDYNLKNKNLVYTFDGSTGKFKENNSNTITLEYALRARSHPSAESLDVNYNVYNKLTNQNNADVNTKTKYAPRKFKGYRGSEVTTTPIRNHEFKEDDYTMSIYRLADDRIKTKILKSDYDFFFQYICSNLVYYTVYYLVEEKNENGDVEVREFLPPEVKFDKRNTKVIVPAIDLKNYGISLTEDCINSPDTKSEVDDDGNVTMYYKEIKLDKDGKKVYFKYSGDLEVPDIEYVDITVGFFRHLGQCKVVYPYTEMQCSEGCRYYIDKSLGTDEYVKITVPVSRAEQTIDMPFPGIIGAGKIETARINNDTLKELVEVRKKDSQELSEYDEEYLVYKKPGEVHIDLVKEKFKNYESITKTKEKVYDIEVFYKMGDHYPENPGKLTNEVTLKHKYNTGIEYSNILLDGKDFTEIKTDFLTGTKITPKPVDDSIGSYEREDSNFTVVEEDEKEYSDGDKILINKDKTIIYKYRLKDDFAPEGNLSYTVKYYWIEENDYKKYTEKEQVKPPTSMFRENRILAAHGKTSYRSIVEPVVEPLSKFSTPSKISTKNPDDKEELDEDGDPYRFRYEYFYEEGDYYDENRMPVRITEDNQKIEIKYIRKEIVTRLPPIKPSDEYDGSYKINYLYSKLREKDGSIKDINPPKKFFEINGNLLNGTTIGAGALNFKKFGYEHLSDIDESYKTLTISGKNNTLNFYYIKAYDAIDIDSIPENCHVRYIDYDDENKISIVPNDLIVGFVGDNISANPINLEDKGYFLLRSDINENEKIPSLNYDYKKNTTLKENHYNSIDFYYRKLKDNEYFKNYKVRYVKEEKDGSLTDLIPEKKVKKLELNGFKDYFENPELIEGYRTTDKPYKISEDNISKTKEIIFKYTNLGYVVKYIDIDTKETLDISEKKIVNIPENKNGENTIYAVENPIDIEHYIAVSDNKSIDHKSLLEKYSIKNDDENNAPITEDNQEYAVYKIKYKRALPFEVEYRDIDTLEIIKNTLRTGLKTEDEKEKKAKPVENYIKVGTKKKTIYRKNFFKNSENPKEGYKEIEYIDEDKNLTKKQLNALIVSEDDVDKESFKKVKVFNYRLDLPYEVKYIDIDTNEEIEKSKHSSLKDLDEVLEKYINISGYYDPEITEKTVKRSDYIKENEDGSKEYLKDKVIIEFKYKKIPKSGLPFFGEIVPVGEKISTKLNINDHFEYIQGYPDNTVRPSRNISREEVSAVFYRLLNENYKKNIYSLSNPFTDVSLTKWSNKHISTLAKGNIIKGYEDNTFRSENFITRAEAAAIASRFDDLEKITYTFSDTKGHWAEKYIDSAHNKGWVKGYEDGTFKPDEYITRAEFITLVNRVLNREVLKENIIDGIKEFKDLDKDKWYYEAIVEAVNGHIYNRENGVEIWKVLEDFNLDM